MVILGNDAADVREVVEDFDAAFERLRESEELRLQRRALREALGHLFSLREHRRETWPNYFTSVKEQEGGRVDSDARVAEGLIFIRGKLVHVLSRDTGPRGAAYMPAFLPSHIEDNTLVWRHDAEMPDPISALTASKRNSAREVEDLANYEAAVAGRLVSTTLMSARRFLVDSPPPAQP